MRSAPGPGHRGAGAAPLGTGPREPCPSPHFYFLFRLPLSPLPQVRSPHNPAPRPGGGLRLPWRHPISLARGSLPLVLFSLVLSPHLQPPFPWGAALKGICFMTGQETTRSAGGRGAEEVVLGRGQIEGAAQTIQGWLQLVSSGPCWYTDSMSAESCGKPTLRSRM